MFKQIFRATLLVALLAGLFFGSARPAAAAGTIHVNVNASGSNNGTSWTNAYTSLQTAIAAAQSGDQIWVAAGIYKPTADLNRLTSFSLKTGVAIYGGFAGGETSLNERDPETNITILSGDIGSPNDISDNSYHVVNGSSTISSAILDGFTITGGNANGVSSNDLGGGISIITGASPTLVNLVISNNRADVRGGGMFSGMGSTPSLTRVVFSGNYAGQSGGGMYNINASPSLTNVTFTNNTSGDMGGGMYNTDGGTPHLTNVTFDGNSAVNAGGGMRNIVANPELTNVTFTGNGATFGGGMQNLGSSPILTNVTFSANTAGGAIYNASSNPIIRNSILYGNTGGEFVNNSSTPVVTYSIVQGGYSGTGNLGTDPLLNGLANNGGFTRTMSLGDGSPAINQGQNITCPPTDQRDIARPQAATCDIGAYERTAAPTFADVPFSYWAWQYIERLYFDGITGGCGNGNYCPATPVTRAQMAVFLLVAEHGAGYTPPAATGVFTDVPVGNPYAAWIEQLADEGITGGCRNGNYCPNSPVTRKQMAVFLLVAEHGSGYTPPPATGVFTDVPANDPFAAWIEQLANEGITGGCGGGNYCPAKSVSRDQMAVFLIKTFNLP
jgi:hypothetical protein